MKTLSEADVGRLDPSRIRDLDIGGAEMRRNAKAICAEWASNPPIYVVNHGLPQAVVGRYQLVKEMLTDGERFTVTPPRAKGYERFDFFNGASVMANMDGAEHDRVRATLTPSFAPRFMANIEGAASRIVDTMLTEVESQGSSFDCMKDFANHLIVRILLDGLLGMNVEQRTIMLRMHEAFALIIDMPPGGTYPDEYLQAQQAALQVVAEVINERRAHPRELDFVSAMVDAQAKSGRINDAEMIGNIFAITGAGLGTTASATGAMLMNLCKHRDQFDQIVANRALIPQAVEECLRYQSSGFFAFPRFALRDCEVGGVKILEGMPVHVSMQAANYDPIEYPDPLKLDIHRNPRNVMTFGVGSHHCLGNRLARLVLRVVLEKVCDRFPDLRLQDPDFEPIYGGQYGELKPESIPMVLGR